MLPILLMWLQVMLAIGGVESFLAAHAADVSMGTPGESMLGYDIPVLGVIPMENLTGPPPGEKDKKYLTLLQYKDTLEECAQVCDSKYWCQAFIFNAEAPRHMRCNITRTLPAQNIIRPSSSAMIYKKLPIGPPTFIDSSLQKEYSGPNPGTLKEHNNETYFYQHQQARDAEYTLDRTGGDMNALDRCAKACNSRPWCVMFEITPLTGRCSLSDVTMPANRTDSNGTSVWKNDIRAFYYEWIGGQKPAPDTAPDPFGGHKGCFKNNPNGSALVLDFDNIVTNDTEQAKKITWEYRNTSSEIDAPLWQSPPKGMTVEMCQGYCAQRGYAYAALRASFLCYCLEELQLPNMTLSARIDCQEQCVGDKDQVCGGFSDYYSVYEASTAEEGQTFNITCVNSGYITGVGMGSSSGALPFVNVDCSYKVPGGERDNGVLDQRRRTVRTVDITASMLAGLGTSTRRRAATRDLSPLTEYDVEVSHIGCDDDSGVAPIAVEVTVGKDANLNKTIRAMKFYCSSTFSDTHALLDSRITSYSQGCPPEQFISAWVIFADRLLDNGHGRLAIQGICSDNTSLPVLGPIGPYMRVLRRIEGEDGRSVRLDTQKQMLPVCAGNISQEVMGGFMGVMNPSVPDVEDDRSTSQTLGCASKYGRIGGVRAYVFNDDPAQILHGLQTTCTNIMCPVGLTGDGVACTDIDECANPNACDAHAECTNTAGSFECECNSGYQGAGNYQLDEATCYANGSSGMSTGAIVGLVMCILAVLAFCGGVIFCVIRRTRSTEREFAAKLAQFERQNGWLDPLSEDARALLRAVQDRGGEVKPHEFTALDVIGQGNFGSVKRGVLLVKGDDGKDLATICAAKVLLQSTPEQEQEFMMECERLKMLRHDDIVGMLGMCHKDGAPHLLMEFCSLGDMCSYLRNMAKPGCKTPLDTLERMWLATQAADGLAYLHSKNLVHRDIAARNVLLDQAPHGMEVPIVDGRRLPVAKISDFGLARALSDGLYVASAGQELPVRWMAPEAIRFSQYSEATDVWSFAVMFWEIFEDARMPLSREFPHNKDFLLAMVQCKRITHSQPLKCPEHIWALIETCFSEEPEARPRMAELHQNLKIALAAIESKSDVFGKPELPSKKLSAKVTSNNYVDNVMDIDLAESGKTASRIQSEKGKGKPNPQPDLAHRYEALDLDHLSGSCMLQRETSSNSQEYTQVLVDGHSMGTPSHEDEYMEVVVPHGHVSRAEGGQGEENEQQTPHAHPPFEGVGLGNSYPVILPMNIRQRNGPEGVQDEEDQPSYFDLGATNGAE